MLFNSIDFILFLVVVVSLYFVFQHRYRWIVLLLANYYFYMSWKAEFFVLIAISTLSVFFLAQAISRSTTKQRASLYLRLGIIVNIGILLFFKYANFIGGSLEAIIKLISIDISLPYLHIILPVGISFYTFQAISYLVDVYRKNIEPERHLGIFAAYISYFPQLVAGPIERASHLLPQFYEKHYFKRARFVTGLKLMLRGFFKKVVIADRIAIVIGPIFADVGGYSGIGLFLAILLFGIQIYGDFSGYTDIARGAAHIMGFDLMKNFRRPYFSGSFTEFWRRWHISLSTWFRDYIYIPLGGNRVTKGKWSKNILFTFLISGLWHGASWTFVARGGLHGLAIIIERFIGWNSLAQQCGESVKRVVLSLQIVISFLLIQISWVFFRANSFGDAWYVLKHMSGGCCLPESWQGRGPIGAEFRLVLVFILLLIAKEFYEEYFKDSKWLYFLKKPTVQLVGYSLLAIIILVFMITEQQDFIYFQF